MRNEFYDSTGFANQLNAKGIKATGGSITRAIKAKKIDAFRIGKKIAISLYELERNINTCEFLGVNRVSLI